jgi:hypothetical protein
LELDLVQGAELQLEWVDLLVDRLGNGSQVAGVRSLEISDLASQVVDLVVTKSVVLELGGKSSLWAVLGLEGLGLILAGSELGLEGLSLLGREVDLSELVSQVGGLLDLVLKSVLVENG